MKWMKRFASALGAVLFATICLGSGALLAEAEDGDAPALKLENLLAMELEVVDGLEVMVSRVTIPPHTSLPKHWHPGEEFAYVLDGVVTLWQEGKADATFEGGAVAAVPLRQVHTAQTGVSGATLLVFRVHQKGQPERVPVE